MTAVRLPKPEVVLSHRGSRYVTEIWYANRFFTSLNECSHQTWTPKVYFRIYGSHLEKSIWRHNSAAVCPITTKFGRQMQNHMPMTTRGSMWKSEVEFRCGCRPLFETGSSFMSAVDW